MGAYSLAGDIDHRADGLDKSHLAMSVGQRRVTAPHLGQGVTRPPAHPAGHGTGPLCYFPNPGMEQEWEHVFGAGEGHRFEQRADLFAESSRGDQDQPFGPIRELVGELHGHTTSEGVADQGDAFLTPVSYTHLTLPTK